MAYKNTHWKLSWGGSVANGADVFVNSLHIGNEVLDMPPLPEDLNDGTGIFASYIALLSDWFLRVDTQISSGSKLEWVKLANIGKDGLYIEDALVRDLPVPVPGQLQAQIAPQLSVALSMGSVIRRGPGKDGRIYPPQSGTPNAAGEDASPSNRAESFRTLLDGINDVEVAANVSASVILVSPLKGGVSAYVRKVRVGNVIDTQRRRRNKIQEVYTELPVDVVEG